MVLALGATGVTAARASESPRDLVRRGNERFHAREFDRARQDYTRAAEADPALLEAVFNDGVARFEQGDYDGAEKSFRRIDAAPGAGQLAAAARYNLGLTEMARLQAAEERTPDHSLPILQRAASNFRSALDLDPDDLEAARNLEVTRGAIRSVQQELQRQQELQQKLDELASRLQYNEQEQRQESHRRAEPRPGEEQEQQRREAEQTQSRISDETEKLRKQLEELRRESSRDQPQPNPDQSSDPDPLSKASEAIDRARDAQKQAQREIEADDHQSARSDQERAADELKEAHERLKPPASPPQEQQQGAGQERQKPEKSAGTEQNPSNNQQPQETPDQADQPQQNAQAGAEPGEPTDQTIERIMNKEKRDREIKARALRALYQKRQPVDKDW